MGAGDKTERGREGEKERGRSYICEKYTMKAFEGEMKCLEFALKLFQGKKKRIEGRDR